MENKLTKEQIAEIETDAEIDVDKAPIQMMNEEAYAWKSGYESGYTVAATKHMLRIKDLEDGLRDLDFGLATMEDYVHGDEGMKITKLRKQIQLLNPK